jgi:hypothetical protein
MTLIISVGTSDFAVQIADRRVVDLTTRKPISDFHGKLMAHPWAGGWASAGLSHVGSESAIRWFRHAFNDRVHLGMSQLEALCLQHRPLHNTRRPMFPHGLARAL